MAINPDVVQRYKRDDVFRGVVNALLDITRQWHVDVTDVAAALTVVAAVTEELASRKAFDAAVMAVLANDGSKQ